MQGSISGLALLGRLRLEQKQERLRGEGREIVLAQGSPGPSRERQDSRSDHHSIHMQYGVKHD